MEKSEIEEIFNGQRQIIDLGIKSLAKIDFCINRILYYFPDVAHTDGPPYVLVSQPEIPERLESLCSAQALAYSCLFDISKRKASESNNLYNKRISRVSAFKSICNEIDTPELRNKGVRNALTHLDERLLKEILKPSNSDWIQDVALSHKEAFSGIDESRYVRVYIFKDDDLHLLGEKMKLRPLRLEVDNIISRIGLEFSKEGRVH